MKKEFLPIAIGFWGIGFPLLASVFIYCQTLPEKITVFLASAIFFLLGILIYRAKI